MSSDICVKGTTRRGPKGSRPVVLLHSLAMSSAIWDTHVAVLGEKHTVVTCDLPGHGRSCEWAQDRIEPMSDEVARYLRTEGVGVAVVAGLSLGGCVAQALAVRHPQLVAGLCLVDTTAWYGNGAAEKWDERARRVVRDGFASLASFQMERWFSPEFRTHNPEIGERLLEIFEANDLGSYVAVCHALGRFDYRNLVSSIGVPCTVMVGELDPATPVEFSRDLASRIPGARLRVVGGAGHMSPVERPMALVDEIENLDKRIDGRSESVD